MLAEIQKRYVVAQQRLCLGGQHHLSSVPAGGDTSGLVHIKPDVVALADIRFACVQTDAHPDRPWQQIGLSLGCGRNCLCRGPKGHEEGIAPCANFDAAVAVERLPQDAAMLREGSNVSLAQLPQ